MGQVHQHALGFQALQHLPAEWSEPTLGQAVGRATDFIVEEMGQAGDAKAGVVQAVDVVQLAFQRMQAFGGQDCSHALGLLWSCEDKVFQVAFATDQQQFAVAIGHRRLQFLALVQGALQQAGPGSARPALGHHQQGDVVAIGAVTFVVEPARGLGHGGKYLQGNMGLQLAW